MDLLKEYNLSGIALRYYNKIEPGKYLNTKEGKEAARKNFSGSKNINYKALIKVLKDLLKEQIKLLQ